MNDTHDEFLARRLARRRSAAASMLRQVSGGRPSTPELTDEQLDGHARAILDRARVVYEVWKTCGHIVPQPLSQALMSFREAMSSATAVIPPPDTEEDDDADGP